MLELDFSSKAQTLSALSQYTELHIPPLLIFSIAQWSTDSESIIQQIQDFAKEHATNNLAVRSSCLSEDKEHNSAAGAYTSVLNVEPTSEKLTAAIQEVIASYGADKCNEDQFFVQPMIAGIAVSGVIMTRALSDGSPYYSLNYDDESGKTDSITGGTRTGKTVFVYRETNATNFDSPQLRSFVQLAKKVEDLCGRTSLDMEFCLDTQGILHLLQVRPMCKSTAWQSDIDQLVHGNIDFIVEFLNGRFAPWAGLYGRTTILGVMPDWNPAEMIGFTPHLLASSLYRSIITSNIWRLARQQMGYRSLPPEELMLLIAGRPYIDVRLSFNSFLPEGINPVTGEALVSAWLENLDSNPHLHDKIEFEIAQTVLDFCFDQHLDQRYPGLLSQSRRKEFHNALQHLTHNCLNLGHSSTVQWSLDAVTELRNRQRSRSLLFRKHEFSAQTALAQIATLLDECRNLGTLPFSILARHAFIATSLLRSAIERGAISQERLNAFMQSVQTISGEMTRDFQAVSQQNLSRETFLAKYGHLRPSSYDILSPRYIDREDLFNGNTTHRQIVSQHSFEFSPTEKENLVKLLSESGLNIDCQHLEQYARTVIAGRELAKFIFTRNLSDILELITIWGENYGLDREELSFLDLHDILNIATKPLLEKSGIYFNKLAKKGKKLFELGQGLKLGYILRSPRDVFIAPQHRSAPNFVGRTKVSATVCKLDSTSTCATPIAGRVVCIENADPGYDWIFTRNIAGLVTKFGGTNSHMAIRCAEYGLPAAIGVGERLFEQISNAVACLLDAGSCDLRPLENH